MLNVAKSLLRASVGPDMVELANSWLEILSLPISSPVGRFLCKIFSDELNF